MEMAPTRITRRYFLIGGVVLATHSIVQSTYAKNILKIGNSADIYITGFGPITKYENLSEYSLMIPEESELVIWNEDRLEKKKIPFLPHYITQSTTDLGKVLIMPKWGKKIIEFDLKTKTVIQQFEAEENYRFFGHGFYSLDGKSVYLSENNDKENKSYIGVWEINSGKYVKKNNIFCAGSRVHDIQLTKDGKYIIACNADKANGSMVWINASTNKIKKIIKFDNGGPAHFYQGKDGYIIYCGGAARADAVSETTILGSLTPDRKIVPLVIPENQKKYLIGETLSLTMVESKKWAFATCPLSDSVFVFNYQTGQFIKRINIEFPLGVNVCSKLKSILVTSGEKKSSLVHFDIKNLKKVKSEKITNLDNVNGLQWGSHLNRIRVF